MPLELFTTRELLFWLGLAALSSLISMWVAYMVIKAAVRDGIEESGLIRNWNTVVADRRNAGDLPDMRAD